MTLKGHLSKSIAYSLSKTGVASMVRKMSRQKVVIPAYKDIVPGLSDVRKRPRGAAITQAAFQQHIAFISENYRTISLAGYCGRFLKGQPFTEPTAILTFDNGYKSAYHLAAPLLEEKGITATVFLPTGLIGTSMILDRDRASEAAENILLHREKLIACFPDEEMPKECSFIIDLIVTENKPGRFIEKVVSKSMVIKESKREFCLDWLCRLGGKSKKETDQSRHLDWDQVRELLDKGWEFGCQKNPLAAHTDNGEIDKASMWQNSFRTFLRKTGKGPVAFSHGVDGLDEGSLRLAKRAGFLCGVTGIRGKAEKEKDIFLLPRISVGQNNGADAYSFEKLLSFG